MICGVRTGEYCHRSSESFACHRPAAKGHGSCGNSGSGGLQLWDQTCVVDDECI